VHADIQTLGKVGKWCALGPTRVRRGRRGVRLWVDLRFSALLGILLLAILNVWARAGRWGNARSPAYGTLSDYQFMRRHSSNEKRRERARAAWGASLGSVGDVVNVFVKYTSGARAPRRPARRLLDACAAAGCCARAAAATPFMALGTLTH